MEDFVPYELAKKLIKKGFIVESKYCLGYYDKLGNFMSATEHWFLPSWIVAPTISQVLKWVREEKKIFVQISLFQYCYDYCILDTTMVYYDNEHKVLHQGPTGYSYEEAALAGIEYVIDNNLI